MGLRFPGQIGENCFFVTSTFINHTRYGDIPGFFNILIDSLRHYSKKYSADIIAYVLMPSHIHLLLLIDGRFLASFMRDFKKFIAQKASKDLGIIEKQIWESRYDRVAISSRDMLVTKLDYIHNNPVKSRLVKCPEEWNWSSAGAYSGKSIGLIELFMKGH